MTVAEDFKIPESEVFDDSLLAELSGMGTDNDFEASVAASRIYPGVYDFRFEFVPATDRASGQAIPGGLGSLTLPGDETIYRALNFTAHILAESVPGDHFIRRVGDDPIEARYQMVSNAPGKRGLSGWGQLYRSLGLVKEFGPTTNDADLLKRLVAASGKGIGRAEFGWRGYDKETGITYSTHPNLKKKDELWPLTSEKFSDGSHIPVDRIVVKGGGEDRIVFGNFRIVNFLTRS